MSQRTFDAVLTSGVGITVRALVGDDQAMLTSAKNNRDGSAFNKMLAGAIIQIGNRSNVDENFVERMLSNDRKDALVMVRQHSLRFQKTFKFNFDWPLEGMQKQLQEYEVEFNDTDFRRVPYAWVQEEIQRRLDEGEELAEGFKRFPQMYDSYEEMLAANTAQRFVLPESQQEIEWKVLTGAVEKKFAATPADSRNSSTLLQMREPKEVLVPTSGEREVIRTSWGIGRADILDVEAFRHEIRRVEGHVDTALTIANQKDASRQTRVDLTTVVDFFFPSSAL